MTLVIELFTTGLAARGQLVINEFAASNSTQIEDPDYTDFADWIELYNGGPVDLNLNGYFITDNFKVPDKWQISFDVSIAAGSYLLIWADGKNVGLHTGYKLSSLGEEIGLFSPELILIDSVSFSKQKTDVSLGRISDGNSEWGFFPQSTPNASNTTEPFHGFVSSIPNFSVRGGFYSTPLSVELDTDFDGEIRYTSDGSEPDLRSRIYSSSIPVESTTIVRSRIFKAGLIPGPTYTQSYFLNENSVQEKLPVVSLATAPENIWDPQTGIYVQDFKPRWDIPVNIELFENNGSDRAAFNELAGAKINGLHSWQLPQKMLGIYFKKQYGSGNLPYPVLHQRTRNSYKSFALRASGSDWSYTLFRDMLSQHATLLNMDIDILGFRPSVVYINGEYMGIHNIREKADDDYIEKSYHMEPGSFDLVENENFAEAGDLVAYNHLLSLLSQDLSLTANYDSVARIVDIKNFTDYVITEMAVGNTSIDHNVMAWKPKKSGKWKWVLLDTDRGYFNPTSNLISFYISKQQLLLKELLDNQSYKDYFARRLAGHLFTSFNPTRMKQLIKGHVKDIEAEIPRHVSRWEGTTSAYGNAMPSVDYWKSEVEKLKIFVKERPYALLADMKSHGYSASANLRLAIFPENAGSLKIDQLIVPGSFCSGPFLKDMPVELLAENKPGYEFLGWAKSVRQTIVPKGSVWKYLDTGADLGTSWIGDGYSDVSWKSGNAQLGYGDGDESTVVGFGADSQNKYITTYFRKKFTVSEQEKHKGQFTINLLKDDGAIVYLNGVEIARSNMNSGNVNYHTEATQAMSGNAESTYISYMVDSSLMHAGGNILAVEVHQYHSTSSDISFDLELSVYQSSNLIVSESKLYTLVLEEDISLTALYTATSNCIIPDTISEDLTLSAACSPYLARGEVTVNENATLTIEPGVEIWMPTGASISVRGIVHALGTRDNGITIRLNPDYETGSWGIISFRNTPRESILNYLTIEDASIGPDPVIDIAAISAFHADLVLDNLTLTNVRRNPISARYSGITLTNSNLHSEVTGDLINVKYGSAIIKNCRFVGNDRPDTDAIDYDEIENGIIRNCQIRDFLGVNSDAIDIGENSTNISIDSIFVFNITDKGVSIGQRSSASIQNSVFINCHTGVAVKDSGRTIINQCIFYNNVDAVASYEKNLGFAGGNVRITNSILSNTSHAPLYVDPYSSLEISYSLTDNPLEPGQSSNLFGNPLFERPSFFDFRLNSESPGLLSGLHDGISVDMGTQILHDDIEPAVMINQFYINAGNLNVPEFLSLYNPSSLQVDLSNFSITKGITVTLPEGTLLDPKEVIYLTDDVAFPGWRSQPYEVLKWESGKLSNNGEGIQLEDNHGIVIDFLQYENIGRWPMEGFSDLGVFQLMDPGLDNHFPENWVVDSLEHVVSVPPAAAQVALKIFPNPTRRTVTIEGLHYPQQLIEIYNLNGQLAGKAVLNEFGKAILDLSVYNSNFLLIKIGSHVEKVILLK